MAETMASPAQPPHLEHPPLHFIVAVWGQKYVTTLLDVTMPTELSAANIPGLRHKEKAVYRFFTTRTDAERIRASSSYAELVRHISVEFVLFDPPRAREKHEFVASVQLRALREAHERGAAVVFLSPDIIVANGSFVALERVAAYSAVMIAAPRVFMPTFVPEMRRRFLDETTDVVSIPPRDLVRLGMTHWHPVTKALFWGRPFFSNWPSILYWSLGQDGVLARYFHMHPLLVNPRMLLADFADRTTSTIDGDLMMSMQSHPEDIYIVTDSDEILIFEASDESIDTGLVGRARVTTEEDLIEFARRAVNPMHEQFVRQRVWFHANGRAAIERYWNIVVESDELISRVLEGMRRPRSTAAFIRTSGFSRLRRILRRVRDKVRRLLGRREVSVSQ